MHGILKSDELQSNASLTGGLGGRRRGRTQQGRNAAVRLRSMAARPCAKSKHSARRGHGGVPAVPLPYLHISGQLRTTSAMKIFSQAMRRDTTAWRQEGASFDRASLKWLHIAHVSQSSRAPH